MRFIHTSDWHLGRRLYTADLTDEHRQFLTWLLEMSVAHQVDAVLVSGDVFDRATPPPAAVRLLDDALAAFASAGIPLVVTPGNHDNAVRLGFGGRLFAQSGVHLRSEFEGAIEPVVLADDSGEVGIYGIPYLLPDSVMERLGADRSHESVLGVIAERIRDDARARGLDRTVVLAHAFITGAAACESEREIKVGGVGNTPAGVFAGFTYVALGHLHAPQEVRLAGSQTVLHYSGSPLAFSFGEANQTKCVKLVQLGAAGEVAVTALPVPCQRPLRILRGELSELLQSATSETPADREDYVKAVLTDVVRPQEPMERLRRVWPNTLVLEFAPAGVTVGGDGAQLEAVAGRGDPAEIVAAFAEYIGAHPPAPGARRVIEAAVERAQETVNL
ncbi:MAG: exonuclease SbcCD subunit D [Candidatus Nanopelagicales bacterium]